MDFSYSLWNLSSGRALLFTENGARPPYYACGKKVKVDALECSLRLGVVRRQRLFPDPESGAR
jgi:hypothetical protein